MSFSARRSRSERSFSRSNVMGRHLSRKAPAWEAVTRERARKSRGNIWLRTRKESNEAFEGQHVAVGPRSRTPGRRRPGDPRAAPERLARVGVREMDLDAGQRDGLQRVVEGDRRVRVRRGVEQDARRTRRFARRRSSRPSSPSWLVCRPSTLAPSGERADLEPLVDLGQRLACRRSRARASREAAGSDRRGRVCEQRGARGACQASGSPATSARRSASAQRCASGSAPCRSCRRA